MKKIQKQIAKYIKDVACGEGLKGVHVYTQYSDVYKRYLYAITWQSDYIFSNIGEMSSSDTLEKKVSKYIGIRIINYYVDTKSSMESRGWTLVI